MKGTNLPQIGFIAQELEQIIPEVVDGKDGSKGISYGNLVAMVVSAVQELNNKIESFFNSLKELVKTKEVQTEKLCVGQICIDEQGLRNILESQNVVNIISPTVNLPEPTESSTTTPAEVATSTLSEIDEPAIIENNETASSTIDE
jgi:hypothetical protein